MKRSNFSKKRIIHIYVVIFIVVMLVVTAALFMFKYHVEGEKNLPFNVRKINIISTAESNLNQDENGAWHAGILQKNDISFVIEKNSNYKKEETIKKVSFDNFQIIKENQNMLVNIYRPTTSVNTYNYIDEYKVQASLEYCGAQATNTEELQINNQGGLIGFSVTSDNLGEYIFTENEKVPSDGKLLAKAEIKPEDINFKISFDLIIETETGHKFRSNMVLDLPTGDILKDGVGTLEDTELNDVIFKRF